MPKKPIEPNQSVVSEEKEFIDEKYNIVRATYPFKIRTWVGFRLYSGGDLESTIKKFEKNYGEIDGTIYWDEKKRMVAIIVDSGSHLNRETIDIKSWKNNE